MKKNFDANRIRPYMIPGLTILLGLVLLFRPDTVTAALSGVVGFLAALAGSAMMIAYFFGSRKDFSRLCCGIVLLLLGFALLRDPLMLARNLGRIVGVFLLIGSFRQLSGKTLTGRVSPLVTMVIGFILVIVPMSASRAILSAIGLAVVIAGIFMLRDARSTPSDPGDDNIIDAL